MKVREVKKTTIVVLSVLSVLSVDQMINIFFLNLGAPYPGLPQNESQDS